MNESWKDFLKYCIHEDVAQPASASDIDWKVLAEFMRKQALIGVMMRGMNKLKGVKIPREVIMHTFALSEQVKKNNQILNKRSVEVAEQYREAGYKCCILKGQGNAVMYPDVYMRQPGDVDVWVCGAREEIISYVKKHHPEAEIRFFHAEYHENGVPVEAHYMPAIMNNPKFNRRLQQFFSEAQEKQCDHWVELPDGVGKIPAPTVEFNIVFQLCHMMHHFFDEGIGLRQMMDYFFLLKSEGLRNKRKDLCERLDAFGLLDFAGAVMYVMKEVFGLTSEYMLTTPNEKIGRMLLEEMMMTGNFGHQDSRYGNLKDASRAKRLMTLLKKNLRFAWCFPDEVVCAFLFRLGQPVWRWWTMLKLSR